MDRAKKIKNMTKYFYIIAILILFTDFANAQCTKIGTFIGTFNSSFLSYVDAEDPQILRAMLSDKNVSFIVNNPTALNDFDSFLDSLSNRNIEIVLTIRFEYSDSLKKEDRIITDSVELDSTMSNIQILLNAANNRITYLQVLNETFGIGRYNTTIDSLTNIYNQNLAEGMVLSWMDTITNRFKDVITSNNYSIDLLSPSIQAKGLEAIKNNQTTAWTYKLTMKIFEVTNLYCDALNFHWYPESYISMQELVEFVDTSSMLQISPTIYKTCTEWSQAHEVRNILQSDTAYWNNALQTHCGTSDAGLSSSYLALINDSLGINHTHTFDMYQLMNQNNYKFASYFAMVQDFYTCGEVDNLWYALCGLYATQFTANKIPNGNFYNQYQDIKQFIYTNCITTGITDGGTMVKNKIYVYPNPTNSNLTIEWQNSYPNERFQVFLYNYSGQLVYQRLNVVSNKLSFATDQFKNGLYFLQINDYANNLIKVEKVIIE